MYPGLLIQCSFLISILLQKCNVLYFVMKRHARLYGADVKTLTGALSLVKSYLVWSRSLSHTHTHQLPCSRPWLIPVSICTFSRTPWFPLEVITVGKSWTWTMVCSITVVSSPFLWCSTHSDPAGGATLAPKKHVYIHLEKVKCMLIFTLVPFLL